MQDHRVANFHVSDGGTDLVHPAGILMPEGVGQGHSSPISPLALDYVQVSAADTGTADLDDDVQRSSDRWFRNFLHHRLLVITR
jgi:hypothetical protein